MINIVIKSSVGVALFLIAGYYLYVRTNTVYKILNQIGGDWGFPPEGAKADFIKKFLRAAGVLFLVFCLVAIYSCVAQIMRYP